MEDPRIQRTKQLLFDAFEELLAVQQSAPNRGRKAADRRDQLPDGSAIV